jgi:4-oxalocrotonate tautomerase
MPILTLILSTDVQLENGTELAQALTELSERVLHKRKEVTAVVFQRIDMNDWWIGGTRTLQPRAQLDIRVTQGTNTEIQKSEFVELAYGLLLQYLGSLESLHPTTYVTVHEVAAANWGYGGLTQHQRMGNL